MGSRARRSGEPWGLHSAADAMPPTPPLRCWPLLQRHTHCSTGHSPYPNKLVRQQSLSPPRRRAATHELLAAPAGDDACAPASTVVRASAAYASRDERFTLKSRDYDRQYAQLYFYRLLQMRQHVEAAARAAWPGIQGARVPCAPTDPNRRPAPRQPAAGAPHRRPFPSPPRPQWCAFWGCPRRARWPLWARCTRR